MSIKQSTTSLPSGSAGILDPPARGHRLPRTGPQLVARERPHAVPYKTALGVVALAAAAFAAIRWWSADQPVLAPWRGRPLPGPGRHLAGPDRQPGPGASTARHGVNATGPLDGSFRLFILELDRESHVMKDEAGR
jgi:hypothetical protein